MMTTTHVTAEALPYGLNVTFKKDDLALSETKFYVMSECKVTTVEAPVTVTIQMNKY